MDKQLELEINNKEILAGAMTLFEELFILDLEKGCYRIYKMGNVMSQVVSGTDFHEFNINYGMKLIHPEDRDKFFSAFLLENIKKRVAAGEKRIAAEVRRKNEEGIYHWCEMAATLFEENSGFPENMIMTFREIDELCFARAEERLATQRFINAVNSAYDAIFEGKLDTDDIYVWKSPGSKIRGFKPEESIDKQLEHLVETSIHPDYQEEMGFFLSRKNVEKEFRGGKTKLYCEAPCIGDEGRYRWLSFQLQLLEMTKTSVHVMYYIKDIDDAKKREKRKHDELQQALAIARKANDAKMEFLSRMSHGIRTPINAIVGMTAVVGEKTGDIGAVDECLKKIDTSAKFLLSLIDDILDMFKIEGGKVNIVNREMNFEKLLEDLSTLCYNLAKDKQQSFEININPAVKRYYIGDSLRLNQIFLNLISNAFKFTPSGGKIRFLVDAKEKSVGSQWLTVTVADNGIGMSEDFIGRAFEPFEQDDFVKGGVTDSSGLGLTLTLSLVVMMGGNISVKSEKGKGTVFTVKFPLKLVNGETSLIESGKTEKEQRCEFNYERILLVEDDELSREIGKALLEIQHLNVETAKSGQEALEKFEKSAPGTYKAVLMDIRMPGMDGLETSRAIRFINREDALTVPIIAVTADTFQDEKREAKKLGINDYLTKPLNVEELYRCLKGMIE